MFVVVAMTTMVLLVPQQASTAVGGVKTIGVPAGTEKLGAQVMTGGMVSTVVTVWEQVVELVQQSVMRQVRVEVLKQGVPSGVMVLKTVMVTFVPQQASIAVGVSKMTGEPH